MDANTVANIVTPASVAIVAVVGYLRSKKTERKLDASEKKIDHVTVVVNQRFTDLENYVNALQKYIRGTGGTVPDDQSKGV